MCVHLGPGKTGMEGSKSESERPTGSNPESEPRSGSRPAAAAWAAGRLPEEAAGPSIQDPFSPRCSSGARKREWGEVERRGGNTGAGISARDFFLLEPFGPEIPPLGFFKASSLLIFPPLEF